MGLWCFALGMLMCHTYSSPLLYTYTCAHICTEAHTHTDRSVPMLGRLCHSWLVHLMWRGVQCPRPGTLLVEVILSVELSQWGGSTVLLIWGCDKHISVWDCAHMQHAVDTWESLDQFCSLTLKQCTEEMQKAWWKMKALAKVKMAWALIVLFPTHRSIDRR